MDAELLPRLQRARGTGARERPADHACDEEPAHRDHAPSVEIDDTTPGWVFDSAPDEKR